MTYRTSGLSIPMPNAIVATMTLTFSMRNLSWFSLRTAESIPAWYGSAGIPFRFSMLAMSSTFCRLRQYIIPDFPGCDLMYLIISFSTFSVLGLIS